MENIISIEKDKAYELVRENIYSCITSPVNLDNFKFIHALPMERTTSAIKNGLLSHRKLAKLQGRELTQQDYINYAGAGHPNGVSYVSVFTRKVDFSQMYPGEILFDPFDTIEVEISLSNELKAYRDAENYYNEFLVPDEIPNKLFTGIDSKILRIKNYDFHNKEANKPENRLKKLISHYNFLREIAIALRDANLDIPLREISEEVVTLDKQKVIELPKIIVK